MKERKVLAGDKVSAQQNRLEKPKGLGGGGEKNGMRINTDGEGERSVWGDEDGAV